MVTDSLTSVAGRKAETAPSARDPFATTQLAILDALPAAVALLDGRGTIIAVNPAWRRNNSSSAMGWEPGLNCFEVCRQSESAGEASAGIRSVLNGSVRQFELECSSDSPGRTGRFRLLVSPLPETNPPGAVVMHIETSAASLAPALAPPGETGPSVNPSGLASARTNRSWSMLDACHESMVRASEETPLLTDICRIAVDIGGYRMAWVGYAQQDETHLIKPMAHAGCEAGYLSEIALRWDAGGPEGRGPAGQVIRSGKLMACPDITAETSQFHWLAAAQRRGYRGVICLPLRDQNRTFGVLALYTGEVRQPDAGELALLQGLADDLAFGITSLRTREDQCRMQEAVLAIARGVSTGVGVDFFDQLNRHMVRALRGDAGFIATLIRPEGRAAHTVSFLINEERQENLNFDLAGTPCENLANGQLVLLDRDAQPRFPKDQLLADLGIQGYVGTPLQDSHGAAVGWMAVLFRRPVEAQGFLTSTMQIFAASAAAELERQHSDVQVREQASLLDKARDAIMVCDLEHRVTFWNQSAEQLYGWTRAEAANRPITDLFFKDAAAFQHARKQFQKTGEWVGEQKHFNREQRELTVESRWNLVRDDDGQARSLLMINTDVTERKKFETQFLRAQRMESIGTLAGGIAHDLNNVLAPILMAVQLLLDKAEDADSKALLRTMQTCSQRGADLVKQVLAFARGVEGERILVNPVHIVREVQKLIHDTFPKNIGFRFKPSRDLWTITGDPTQLHQVLMNLAVNARDAMPDGGQLTVTMENVALDDVYVGMNPGAKTGTFVVIQVLDTGAGVPPAIREKIFEPFFTTKEVGKGTGLGLSTTLAIVRSHGGFIQLFSEEGKGTEFKIYLPAHPGSVGAERLAFEQNQLPRGHDELILVVDDEAGIRDVAERALTRFGYRVLLAANGAEAVAFYAQRRGEIAVVLTDMAMPVMDGPATIIALRAMNPKLRIIGCSGLTSNADVSKAVAEGVQHFIPKPFTAEKMLQTLALVLRAEP